MHYFTYESYWWVKIFSTSNFWTAISGFGGALLGGLITWKIQLESEKGKVRTNKLSLFRYHITKLEKIYAATSVIWSEISVEKDAKNRHFSIQRLPDPLPTPQERDITLDLYFLATEKQLDVLADMELYSQRFAIFYSAYKERNDLYNNLLISIMALGKNNITISEMEAAAGLKLSVELKTSTDIVFQNAELLATEYAELRKQMGAAFKRLFPKEPLLALTPRKFIREASAKL